MGYIHDIGIRVSEEKNGRYDGKSQELYGEPAARAMLADLGFAPEDIERISLIVGKHHTYNAAITGLDFRILLEADACVNMYEKGVPENAKYAMLENVFKTDTGKKLYTTMFNLNDKAAANRQ